jgi:hypothetical protein
MQNVPFNTSNSEPYCSLSLTSQVNNKFDTFTILRYTIFTCKVNSNGVKLGD